MLQGLSTFYRLTKLGIKLEMNHLNTRVVGGRVHNLQKDENEHKYIVLMA